MTLSVSELVAELRRAVEGQVGDQVVVGEVGSCKPASSGHVYFTIKDERAQLDCVMYKFQAAASRVVLREGMKVELFGKATVYEGRGRLQFTVTRVREAGLGELQARFEALKRKLAAEGLFDAEGKLELPPFPKSVGLITSATGAVIQDMRHVFERRAPWIKVFLLPVQVQGAGAEHGIASAVRAWGRFDEFGLPPVDLLIVARGGGSLEDMWCFNEEVVARAIAECPVPVVSAVGHETDFTIADFVADLRAPTPTAAVELVTPDGPALDAWLEDCGERVKRRLYQVWERADLMLGLLVQRKFKSPLDVLNPFIQRLDDLEYEWEDAWQKRLQSGYDWLDRMELELKARHPKQFCRMMGERLDGLEMRLKSAAAQRFAVASGALELLAAQVEARSPQETLKRGYALVQGEDGRLVRDAEQVPEGARLRVSLARGQMSVVRREDGGEAADGEVLRPVGV